MKLNCIIVDDEPLALDILEEYVHRTPSLRLIGRAGSASGALELLSSAKRAGDAVDLALLDIQMPGMNGLELAKALGGGTRVVFTTAFPQYALDGFRTGALDYLVKPVSFAEFTRAVDRAVEWFGRSGAVGSGTHRTAPAETPQTLIVRSAYKHFIIPLDEIVCIEGIRDYIRIHTSNASGEAGSVQTLMNMKTIEQMLPPGGFARVHRSWIVNLDRVKRIERAHILLDESAAGGLGKISIPVSDTYRESLLGALSARSI